MVSTLIPSADLAPSVTSRVLIVKATDFTEGAPAKGTITFSLPWDVDVKPDGVILQAGSKTLDFDETGQMQIRVPTADPDTNPTAWFLTVKKSWAPHAYAIRVPVGTTPINLVDVPIVQEVPAGTPAGVLLTGASATVKIGAAPDVKTTVAAGVANFDFTLPDYGPELDKVEIERLAAQAAKVDAQTAATASATSAGQSAGSAAAAAASAAQAAAPTDTVVSTLLTTPTSLARRALDSAVADKRNVVPTAITAGVNADLLRAPDTYHFRTDAIAAASTGLPVPLAGFLDVTASARARRNSLYNSGPRSAVVTGWGFQAGTGEVVSGPTTPTTPNAAPEGRTGFISRSVTTQRSSGSSGWFYRAEAGEVVGGVGDVRTLSMWVKYSHAVSVQLSTQLRPSPAAASPSVLGPIVAVPANTWTRLSVTTTATAAYDGCQIWAVVQSNTPVPVGGTYDAADAQAELSPVLTPYFDGSMPATSSEIYSYEGAADASASLASGFITREYRTMTGRRFTQQLTAAGWSSWSEIATTSQVSNSVSGLVPRSALAMITPTARTVFFDRGAFVAYMTIVDTGGAFMGGIVGKEYAGNLQDTGATGAAFKPVKTAIQNIAPYSTAPIRSNSSGWRVTGGSGTTAGNVDEIIGLQIRKGVLLHDFDAIGVVALGFKADGTSKIYRSSSWTGAQVVADGVVDSFAFGPATQENGVTATIAGTERSGRTLLGQQANGTIVLVNIPGLTGSYGATMQEAANFMRDFSGARNAIALDGGGSSQLLIGNNLIQPSSDAGGTRPIPDVLTIRARVDISTEIPWTALPLGPGVTIGDASRSPQYRVVNGRIETRGRVFGAFTVGYSTAGSLPSYLTTARGGTGPGVGAGGVTGIITVAPGSVNVQVYPAATVGWFDLGGFTYSQAG